MKVFICYLWFYTKSTLGQRVKVIRAGLRITIIDHVVFCGMLTIGRQLLENTVVISKY